MASSSIQVVNAASAPQPTIDTAIQAVVRILPQRCGPAGCRQLSVGSGAIVHPSGVILTAWHVTVEDPGNLVSPAYADDFVVEMTEDVRRQPVPRYRAELIAVKPEMDLALLRIYQEIGTNRPLAQDSANALPTLPISDNIPSTGQLRIMGYPLAGGGSIKYPEFGISGFTDDGTLMTIQGTLSPGYSGGPALFEQDGRFAIVGVVIRRRGDLGEVGLLRSIDQLKELTWEPTARRVWAENVQVSMTASNDADFLLVSADIQTLDYVNQDGRLVVYVFAADSQQPWIAGDKDLTRSANGQVVFSRTFDATHLVDTLSQTTLVIPLKRLAVQADRLAFRLLLWDLVVARLLWQDSQWHYAQIVSTAVAIAPAVPATATPTPTPTPIATPTNPPQPTSTPTNTPSPTLTETLAPTPTVTDTPVFLTATPTNIPRSPTTTSTPTLLPSSPTPPPPYGSVQLLEPSDNDSGSDKRVFRWLADFTPTEGQAFELIFWKAGQDPLTNGFGLAPPTTGDSVSLDLIALDDRLGALLEPGEYQWGVLLVKLSPYERLQFLGASRKFTLSRNSGGSSIEVNPTPSSP